jgi:hypothetical protein
MDIPGATEIAGSFDFGMLTASAIDAGLLAQAVMAGVNSELNPDAPVDYAALYRDLTSPIDGGIDRVDWTGMTLDVSGLKFNTSAMQAQVTRNADGVVIANDLPRFTMKLTADSSNGAIGAMGLMMLAMAGYESNEIELYLGSSMTFDPAKDLTRWADYNIGVTDLFDVKMSGGVLGLKQALPSLMSGLMSIADFVRRWRPSSRRTAPRMMARKMMNSTAAKAKTLRPKIRTRTARRTTCLAASRLKWPCRW